MDELESQIAKIQLGNNKTSNSYVFLMAEATASAELYVVAELPLFNPAAEEACERICLAIAAALKRAYKRPAGESTFENAIAEINEELGKLAAMGQTQWIDRLNCILSAKEGGNFSIATCGKTAAYLLRNREYTDISCSATQSHPLKTFENYASGKIRLGDLLVLSTTQLFNYISMDRLLDIVSESDFLTATRTVIELLKQNADPQTSFAVLMNLQVPEGQTQENEADLENYVVESATGQENLWAKGLAFIKTTFALDRKTTRVAKTDLPKVSLGQRLQNIRGNTQNLAQKSKHWWQKAKTSAKNVQTAVKAQNFNEFSPQKKFFLASAVVLLIALVANIAIAAHLKKTHATSTQITGALNNAQTLLANAQASLLYKDYQGAGGYLQQVKAALPNPKLLNSAEKTTYNKLLAEYDSEEQQLERVVQVQVTNLGSLGQGGNLIRLPQYAATQSGTDIVSYNKQTGQTQDGALSAGIKIVGSAYVSGNLAVVYDGASLYVWDFSAGKLSPGFAQSVPVQSNFGGIAYYPVNSRVYVVDKSAGDIVNFVVSKSGLSKPVVSLRDASLSQAIDLTIGLDGSIYVLTPSGINKYFAGSPTGFTMPQTSTAFSGKGKIYTEQGYQYIYLLDEGNNRILVMDKTGALEYTLESPQFTKLTDFQVDENNKLIYLLNDGSLLKINLP